MAVADPERRGAQHDRDVPAHRDLLHRVQALVDAADRADARAETALHQEADARNAAERASRDEGRVPRHALARAPHAAQRDPRLGGAAAASAGSIPRPAARGLETIERNARRRRQLIEDLLDMSRIVSGKLRLDVRGRSRCPSSRRRRYRAARGGRQGDPALHTVLDPHAGPVSGDPERLQQVIWNLLSNAIKFTPKDGRVEVRLRAGERAASRSSWPTRGRALRPSSCPTSSTASARPTPRPRARTAASASAWPSPTSRRAARRRDSRRERRYGPGARVHVDATRPADVYSARIGRDDDTEKKCR